MSEDISRDSLLDGRVVLGQPAAGDRAAIDPVFLAASVAADAGERVLDAGSGAGPAALCLAARVPHAQVTGIERNRTLVRLAGENAAANGCADRVKFLAGDILAPPAMLGPGAFDHVMANPPHHAPERTVASPSRARAAAHREGAADLAAWVRFAFNMVRPKGSVSLVHRADRLDSLLPLVAAQGGEIVVFPLWPKAGAPARRVLVRARKGVATPLRLAPGLVLHADDGTWTAAAAAVLRAGTALTL